MKGEAKIKHMRMVRVSAGTDALMAFVLDFPILSRDHSNAGMDSIDHGLCWRILIGAACLEYDRLRR